MLRCRFFYDDASSFNDVTLEAGGKALVVSARDQVLGLPRVFSVMRYLPNGAPDLTFGSGGIALHSFVDGTEPGDDASTAYALAFRGGRVYVAGAAQWLGADFDFGTMRLSVTPLFSEGFESGGTDDWSRDVP